MEIFIFVSLYFPSWTVSNKQLGRAQQHNALHEGVAWCGVLKTKQGKEGIQEGVGRHGDSESKRDGEGILTESQLGVRAHAKEEVTLQEARA